MSLKVCVTGAKGFIGQNLLPILHNKAELEAVTFPGDLLSITEVDDFFNAHPGIDTVIHLVGTFSGTTQELIEMNVITTVNLLEAAQKHSVKKVIFTSSGAVYGEPVGTESSEDDPLLPNGLYGQAKLWAEDAVRFCERNYGLKDTILRFPNVYGPKNQKGVIYNMLSDIKTKGSVTIYGDGTQSRNFLHVDDACRAIILALENSTTGVFNISNPVKISINDAVELLKKDYQFNVVHSPADNSLKDLLLNVSHARKVLGFTAEIKDLRLHDLI